MYCRRCGKPIKDNFRFCDYCGEPVYPTPYEAARNTENNKPNSNKKHHFHILGSLILILIFAIIGGYFLYRYLITSRTLNYDELSKSVVKIVCYDINGEEYASGSGSLVLYDNVIVTNYHVIADEAYSFEVITDNGKSIGVDSVIAYDEIRDVAILLLKEPLDVYPLEIGDSEKLKRGDKIITIGSPEGYLNTVSEGIVSGFIEEDNIKYIQITAPISHGSSGGALLNSKGELVGITTLSHINAQNINFALPSYEINMAWESGKVDMDLDSFYNLREHYNIYSIPEILSDSDMLNGEFLETIGYVYELNSNYLRLAYSLNDSRKETLHVKLDEIIVHQALKVGDIISVKGFLSSYKYSHILTAKEIEKLS